jgi:hypothetical protein
VKRTGLLALVALAIPTLAACGGGTAATSATGHAHKAAVAARRAPRPTALVLRSADIGSGYLVEPSGTRRITLAVEMQHESRKAKAADRHGFVGGYSAEYVLPGKAGVLSEAVTYRDATAARIVSTDRQGLEYAVHGIHGHLIKAPRAAPGQPRVMMRGTVKGLPVISYGWQQGSVLEIVTVFGNHVTQAQVMALAKKQDARLTHPTFGA